MGINVWEPLNGMNQMKNCVILDGRMWLRLGVFCLRESLCLALFELGDGFENGENVWIRRRENKKATMKILILPVNLRVCTSKNDRISDN